MVYKNHYEKAFEQRCFQLMIEAYQTSLVERVIKLNWNENDISSEIHQYIKVNPLRLKWRISTNVEPHIPKDIPKSKGFADKFPRIDFRLTTFSINNEYEYFFEAKNLKQHSSALKRRYINTGIDNFVSGRYENGSLIGYLLEGGTKETIEGINSLLAKDKRSTEALILKSDKRIPIDTIYESLHFSTSKLKHLIFDLTSLSN